MLVLGQGCRRRRLVDATPVPAHLRILEEGIRVEYEADPG